MRAGVVIGMSCKAPTSSLKAADDPVLAGRELADRPLPRNARLYTTTRLSVRSGRVALASHIEVNPAQALGAPLRAVLSVNEGAAGGESAPLFS